jgi:hypothetical protein
MHRIKLHPPSPALVIALLALFLACAGTAGAMSLAQTGPGHAHAAKKHHKHKRKHRRAVNGVNGVNGANGAQGIQGPQGPQGPKGDKGDMGDIGPSDVFEAFRTSYVVLDTSNVEVATLDLPAGKFAVDADVHIQQLAGADAGQTTCSLLAGGGTVNSAIADMGVTAGTGRTKRDDIWLGGTFTQDTAGSALLVCKTTTALQAASAGRVVATKVGSVSSAPTT